MTTITLDAAELARALPILCRVRDLLRPPLMECLILERNEDGTTISALDGYRLLQVPVRVLDGDARFVAMLPPDLVDVLRTSLRLPLGNAVHVAVTGGQVELTHGTGNTFAAPAREPAGMLRADLARFDAPNAPRRGSVQATVLASILRGVTKAPKGQLDAIRLTWQAGHLAVWTTDDPMPEDTYSARFLRGFLRDIATSAPARAELVWRQETPMHAAVIDWRVGDRSMHWLLMPVSGEKEVSA